MQGSQREAAWAGHHWDSAQDGARDACSVLEWEMFMPLAHLCVFRGRPSPWLAKVFLTNWGSNIRNLDWESSHLTITAAWPHKRP